VLLAQRIEVLSTVVERCPGCADALRTDVANWQEQAAALPGCQLAQRRCAFPAAAGDLRGQLTLVGGFAQRWRKPCGGD
jgi:hypothetical protein